MWSLLGLLGDNYHHLSTFCCPNLYYKPAITKSWTIRDSLMHSGNLHYFFPVRLFFLDYAYIVIFGYTVYRLSEKFYHVAKLLSSCNYTSFNRELYMQKYLKNVAVNAWLSTLTWDGAESKDNCLNIAKMTTQDVQCWSVMKYENRLILQAKKSISVDFGRSKWESGGVQEKGEGQH